MQEEGEQALFAEKDEILQHVQKNAGDFPSNCCGEASAPCCGLLGGEQPQSC